VKVVIDANVLVSALLSPFGGPSQILELVSSSKITLLIDSRIFAEYREVLKRKRFFIPPDLQVKIPGRISELALWISSEPLKLKLPDPEDRMFVEVAMAGNADILITGNKKHFPLSTRKLRILTPSEFLTYYVNNRTVKP
jgi:putative PIN family toxin of toxin-antitoxin system